MDPSTLDGTIELGGVEVPEEVRKWIVSTFSRHEQDEKERKSKFFNLNFSSETLITKFTVLKGLP